MNDAAKTWVAALRSGEWQQCRNALQAKLDDPSIKGFCCLGVACQISGLGEWYDLGLFRDSTHIANDKLAEENRDPDVDPDEPDQLTFEEEFTSPDIQKWLGLRTKDGELTIDGERTSLAALNDKGRSFPEIANIIEMHADQLFRPETKSC